MTKKQEKKEVRTLKDIKADLFDLGETEKNLAQQIQTKRQALINEARELEDKTADSE